MEGLFVKRAAIKVDAPVDVGEKVEPGLALTGSTVVLGAAVMVLKSVKVVVMAVQTDRAVCCETVPVPRCAESRGA